MKKSAMEDDMRNKEGENQRIEMGVIVVVVIN
jgi:hypothetical protein